MKIYIGKENQALSDKEFLRKLTIPNKYKPNYVDWDGNPREYDRFQDGYDDYDNRGFAVLVYKTASTSRKEEYRSESLKVSSDMYPYIMLSLDMTYNEYKKAGNIFCPQVKALDEWRFRPLLFYNAEPIWLKDSVSYTGDTGPIAFYVRNTQQFATPHVHSMIVSEEYEDKVQFFFNCVNYDLTLDKSVDFNIHSGGIDNLKAYKEAGNFITIDRTAFRNAKDKEGKPYSMKLQLTTGVKDFLGFEDNNDEFRRDYYINKDSTIGFLYKTQRDSIEYNPEGSERRGIVKLLNKEGYVRSINPTFEIDLTDLEVGYYMFKGKVQIDTKKIYSEDWSVPEGKVYENNLKVYIRIVETGNF